MKYFVGFVGIEVECVWNEVCKRIKCHGKKLCVPLQAKFKFVRMSVKISSRMCRRVFKKSETDYRAGICR